MFVIVNKTLDQYYTGYHFDRGRTYANFSPDLKKALKYGNKAIASSVKWSYFENVKSFEIEIKEIQ